MICRQALDYINVTNVVLKFQANACALGQVHHGKISRYSQLLSS